MGEAILSVDDLHVWLRSNRGPVRAVDGVTFDLERGQVFGIVGESGSGKSVTARALMGLLPSRSVVRRSGRVVFRGRDLLGASDRVMMDIRGREIAMVLQNPMSALNPVLKVGTQVGLPVRRHTGLRGRALRSRVIELLDDVAISDPERRFDEYPSQLSGGQQQRVALAIALSGEPSILLADEPTTALDVTVQAQILALIDRIRVEREMAVVLITHDIGVVAKLADIVGVMYAGKFLELAPAARLFAEPQVPYTEGLLEATPLLEDPARKPMYWIPGRPPDLIAPPAGCRFAPRCFAAREVCANEAPSTSEYGVDHTYACWFPRHLRARTTTGATSS
jgi:oligopeptide/dipeptide ABC transporter ATP-binding protein